MPQVHAASVQSVRLSRSRMWSRFFTRARLTIFPHTPRVMWTVLLTPRRGFSIPPTEALTSRWSPLTSSAYTTHIDGPPTSAEEAKAHKKAFSFPLKATEQGIFERGVSSEAKDFAAAAEREYRASVEYLDQAPGGCAGLPEVETRINAKTKAVETITRIAAPFAETYVPSGKERFAMRGNVGELSYQRSHPRRELPDERAMLNLRKERQLEELLLSSQMAILPKAREVSLFLISDFYKNLLVLQPRNAEAVIVLFSQASLQLRLRGLETEEDGAKASVHLPSRGSSLPSPSLTARSGEGDPNCIPYLSDMRRLYAHQKACFAAPTPLMAEQLMSALSAVPAASSLVFHLAGRIFIDCDKYVVLPTRTTYAAFFSICRLNHAMPFAIARMTDGVCRLRISLDAAMATAMLRGLNEGGYAEEAVALLARIEKVPLTTPLLNASLETLLLSSQAASCFSALEAAREARLQVDGDTYTLLLLACEKSGEWARTTAILADMQRHHVKGTPQTLNLLLKGLLMEKLHSYALQLHHTMQGKRVEVWPALEEAVKGLRRTLGNVKDSRRHGKFVGRNEKSPAKVNYSQRHNEG
ncbi:unnamed protein product [Phytomonas sp. Hart1]|nr:unnamed protein product [Phytomonas sp. Hart1]|eukprot:CCW67207.1 unnamed protein product [Phytomonas sp. isolate Hart1]